MASKEPITISIDLVDLIKLAHTDVLESMLKKIVEEAKELDEFDIKSFAESTADSYKELFIEELTKRYYDSITIR